jgi:TonB family protein
MTLKNVSAPLSSLYSTRRSTNASFVVSALLHALLLIWLAMTGTQKAREDIKLTEISYLEERYGAEVAKKVTVAPEKVPAKAKAPEPAKREGSLFAKKKPKPMDEIAAAVPLPKPVAKNAENPFKPKKTLKSRRRSSTASLAPKVKQEDVALAAGLDNGPALRRQRAETVDLEGKVLVGKSARLADPIPFEVSEGDEGNLATSTMTLALPSGGSAQGHPDLVGGTLAPGKEVYRGALPSGTLVGKAGGERLSSLADVEVVTPIGDDDAPLIQGGFAEPTAGKGLISRGGSDAVTRGGGLVGKRAPSRGPAVAMEKELAPAAPQRDENAPAESKAVKAPKGVTMTLSGPILGREILKSSAPAYPQKAKEKGWQGVVSIYFTVRPDGSINKVMTEQASAHRILDEAAKRCIQEWRFSPKPDAAEQWGILTIVFRLR